VKLILVITGHTLKSAERNAKMQALRCLGYPLQKCTAASRALVSKDNNNRSVETKYKKVAKDIAF
jgi:hypothetical protein